VGSQQWSERVLNNPRPVMVHLWSRHWVPERSEALAPIVDDVALAFNGKLDVVRSPGTARCPCCCARRPPIALPRVHLHHLYLPLHLYSPFVMRTQCTLAFESSKAALQFDRSMILPAVAFIKVRNRDSDSSNI